MLIIPFQNKTLSYCLPCLFGANLLNSLLLEPFSSFYSGFNVQELMESLHAPEWILKPFHAAGGSVGVFATAYVLYKVFGPIRYLLTLWLTPLIVHRLRREGLVKPLAERDRLRNLAREGAKRARERLKQNKKRRIRSPRK